MSKPSVGFVGAMGFGMATHLVSEGYSVTGFDIFPASVQRFHAAGGIPALSLRESVEDKPYYVYMVASASHVQSVLFAEEGIVQYILPLSKPKRPPQNATLLLVPPSHRNYTRAAAATSKRATGDSV
ncbi:uncharacterized protein ATNIH1004_009098 [Aspergillus tanneri]|uniref:6-phosphogluconate dehydrogenase NADP-binding domain-containing protein n=1 Tax=Aspergillus tanneri TaxID=1220188 RepID=A0A5M9MKF6_9EURO|nr:uncharacterized protein ATNIH1004_009098 [Aspergillus tanneri]KAA8644889.1 hypothetical protein ATNIH1004_009098 [Aspergillus tanneri]